jgi:hypothetical protein
MCRLLICASRHLLQAEVHGCVLDRDRQSLVARVHVSVRAVVHLHHSLISSVSVVRLGSLRLKSFSDVLLQRLLTQRRARTPILVSFGVVRLPCGAQ